MDAIDKQDVMRGGDLPLLQEGRPLSRDRAKGVVGLRPSLRHPQCAAEAVAGLGAVGQGALTRAGVASAQRGLRERCWGILVLSPPLADSGPGTDRCSALSSPGLLGL